MRNRFKPIIRGSYRQNKGCGERVGADPTDVLSISRGVLVLQQRPEVLLHAASRTRMPSLRSAGINNSSSSRASSAQLWVFFVQSPVKEARGWVPIEVDVPSVLHGSLRFVVLPKSSTACANRPTDTRPKPSPCYPVKLARYNYVFLVLC
ncbi:hypothetical protein GQ43DRAFT_8863 [Delitschia confertaspora ATCC 74209]|uniref:Uncharacterized protein n=1 Tax=Delitschia confertaspora ATCC 74209 TaxID=1513339 RepID=A0A9P4JPR4_9PLEO|nr:hypothetical protein GQ43DRAFT_8863 [Delitschia confertaspora ATCC 74209]